MLIILGVLAYTLIGMAISVVATATQCFDPAFVLANYIGLKVSVSPYRRSEIELYGKALIVFWPLWFVVQLFCCGAFIVLGLIFYVWRKIIVKFNPNAFD